MRSRNIAAVVAFFVSILVGASTASLIVHAMSPETTEVHVDEPLVINVPRNC